MPCIAMVLVVDFVILAVGSIVMVLSRETALHPLVHGGALQSLFWHLTLVTEALVGELLLHLIT